MPVAFFAALNHVDVVVCGLIAAFVAGVYLVTKGDRWKSLGMNYPISIAERLMLWFSLIMFSALLLVGLIRR